MRHTALCKSGGLVTSLALILVLAAGASLAADGVINFSGRIIGPTCSASANGPRAAMQLNLNCEGGGISRHTVREYKNVVNPNRYVAMVSTRSIDQNTSVMLVEYR